MNIQIVKPQPGPQAAFIQCTADVVCYGGARGGGKSWAIALDFWLHAERHGEDARGLILRKTREDLKDFIDTAGHMYAGSARYSEKGNFFRFTSGAKLYCGYLEREADAANYQGWSLTRLYFDELTQLTTLDPVLRLLALPFTILTLGLFLLVVNACLLKLASLFTPGFKVHGFLSAVLGSLVLTILTSVLRHLVF